MTYENGRYVFFTPRDESHPNWGKEEKDLDHRRFTFTPLASQIRSAFRKGLWLKEHDDADGDDLLAIFRNLVDTIDRTHPEVIGDCYEKLRPKVEKFYKERNRRYRQTK